MIVNNQSYLIEIMNEFSEYYFRIRNNETYERYSQNIGMYYNNNPGTCGPQGYPIEGLIDSMKSSLIQLSQKTAHNPQSCLHIFTSDPNGASIPVVPVVPVVPANPVPIPYMYLLLHIQIPNFKTHLSFHFRLDYVPQCHLTLLREQMKDMLKCQQNQMQLLEWIQTKLTDSPPILSPLPTPSLPVLLVPPLPCCKEKNNVVMTILEK